MSRLTKYLTNLNQSNSNNHNCTAYAFEIMLQPYSRENDKVVFAVSYSDNICFGMDCNDCFYEIDNFTKFVEELDE